MGDRTFGIITYEAELLPQNWVDDINRHLTALIVPSRYVAKAAADSGISGQIDVSTLAGSYYSAWS